MSGRRLGLMLLPAALLFTCVASPCRAQEMQVKVAVFEFNDLSGYAGHVLGARAAARMQVELRDSGRFTMVPRADVRRECAALDLKPPFAVGYQQQVLSRLGAILSLTGTLRSCRIDAKSATASVTMVAELSELAGGEQVAILKATGVAQGDRKKPVAADVLVEEALATAGREITRSLTAGTQVKGKLVSASAEGQKITVDADAGTAFVAGMKALLYHRKDDGTWGYAGLAGIEAADKTAAQGKVLSARGDLKEGDLVVGIFGGAR
jgi:hypothetical protein